MLELVYYTRKNCQLCDDGREQIKLALSELRYNKVKLTSFDIDEDDRLQQEYMVRVPVLKHKGEVVQEGLIDFVRVYDYLKEYLGKSKI
ncbi:MAG TPA: glutaredoxin family protein [Candidatus Salinicoccus stercoripullorum]|uniref:Glutaredoxin family protein n=1 Tax=Candidatus Salinicoccus stercoripullorum TaxID=2838756 RepID=A0A9D1TZH0_9STAP|nr:glutaredoxin family protein [Candidatus Salinicoccus stercoripullorum]